MEQSNRSVGRGVEEIHQRSYMDTDPWTLTLVGEDRGGAGVVWWWGKGEDGRTSVILMTTTREPESLRDLKLR